MHLQVGRLLVRPALRPPLGAALAPAHIDLLNGTTLSGSRVRRQIGRPAILRSHELDRYDRLSRLPFVAATLHCG
jgi:hypothetical protein